ncbi:MAG TPA: FHA domain-containing protein, partial [Vicinamibacteria bacterium]
MAKLIVNPTSVNRREIPLARATILTIGRDPSNDLVLPDAMVSRRHAVVEHRGGQFFLRDCGSANGSVVNGDRVSERGLRDGDLVAIGSMRLLFREEIVEAGSSGKVVLHPSAAPLACPSCGGEYRRGDLFCRECGTQVAQPSGPPKTVCASCGSAVPLPARFCNACGATLAGGGGRLEDPAPPEGPPQRDTRPVAVPRAEEPAAPRAAGSMAI